MAEDIRRLTERSRFRNGWRFACPLIIGWLLTPLGLASAQSESPRPPARNDRRQASFKRMAIPTWPGIWSSSLAPPSLPNAKRRDADSRGCAIRLTMCFSKPGIMKTPKSGSQCGPCLTP